MIAKLCGVTDGACVPIRPPFIAVARVGCQQPQARGASGCWILFVGRAYPISKLHNNLERFFLSGAAEVGAEAQPEARGPH